MKKKEFQYLVGKVIVYSNGFLFVLIVVMFLFKGFLNSELAEIMKFLVPIQAVYMTAIVKFMVENKYVKKEGEAEEEDRMLTPLYVKLTRAIVFLHIIAIGTGIFLKGIGTIDQGTLTSFVAIVETFFGIYIGGIILDLFKTEEPKKA